MASQAAMDHSNRSLRHVTPPSIIEAQLPDSAQSNNAYYDSWWSEDASPASINTANTTPPRSPARTSGPLLLPKIRSQDQTLEPKALPIRHKRNLSTSSTGFPVQFSPYPLRPSVFRRSMSPSHYGTDSPTRSAHSRGDSCGSSAMSALALDSTQSLRPRISHPRSSSTSAIRTHSRSGSASSIDELTLGRFGYPTYRQMPDYLNSHLATASAINCESPQCFDPMQNFDSIRFFVPMIQEPLHPMPQYSLAAELQYESFDEPPPTTTLMDYLTSPNPSPALVRRARNGSTGHDLHFWFDIRNIRSWSDFTLKTIQNIPGFMPLLDIPIPEPALPKPVHRDLHPETESALLDLYYSHYAMKINAALRVAQGIHHMSMRAQKPSAGAPQEPDFLSNYDSDYEKTILGESRGRVVGLVKSYETWNTGMRAEGPHRQVEYLRGLAHLHRCMREHSCRYGFIITEIELVCVRAGIETVPYFGFLELASPIFLSTCERGQMTACLGLWYLHMLAKEDPLPGQGISWRLDVGGPAALTRRNHLDKDDWIPKPNLPEKRMARRMRGWVFPDEPLSRKECIKSKRTGSR